MGTIFIANATRASYCRFASCVIASEQTTIFLVRDMFQKLGIPFLITANPK